MLTEKERSTKQGNVRDGWTSQENYENIYFFIEIEKYKAILFLSPTCMIN